MKFLQLKKKILLVLGDSIIGAVFFMSRNVLLRKPTHPLLYWLLIIMYLLFPWRHHILTSFQCEYLHNLVGADTTTLRDVWWHAIPHHGTIDSIVRPITSANHADTRRNPLPWSRREAMIQDFATTLTIPSYIYHIDDVGQSDQFASYVIKKIFVESEWEIALTPENTIVACSTPSVIDMYVALWFSVLPVELEDYATGKHQHMLPWELVEYIAQRGATSDLSGDEFYRTHVSDASKSLYRTYHIEKKIAKIFADPLLHNDGDITQTRDYNAYVRAFDEWAERKYALTKQYITPGKIVDIWCCTGSYIRELTKNERLRESDFYGIEVASRLYKECLNRKEEWYFANDNVFFYHRNIAQEYVFPENFVDTFTTFSLTHEIESYQGRSALQKFLSMIYTQTALWWSRINVDVVGPEDGDRLVHVCLSRDDGLEHDATSPRPTGLDHAHYFRSLSTYSRFQCFVQDFRRKEWYTVSYDEVMIDGVVYIAISLRDIYEFMTKKDYCDNRYSEMHETFGYWSYTDWIAAVASVWFHVHPDSHSYRNSWIVENRREGRIQLFSYDGSAIQPLPFPDTNMLVIATK